MMKCLLHKSVFFGSALVALFFLCSGITYSQGLDKEISLEENIPTKEGLTVKYIAADLDGADLALGQVDPLKVELQIQDLTFPNGGGSVQEVSIRGFHNGETIFFGIKWNDASKNDRAIAHAQFRDAVGLMFPLETCKKYRFNNPKGVACGKCIKVCPWNKAKGWTHNFVRWTVGHAPYMNDFLIKMDQVWGYGRPALDKKWWFDPRRAE